MASKRPRRKRRPGLARERRLRADGAVHVAGVDEVGRGPLAGPVVAAAVILPKHYRHSFLNDSKRLSPARREEAAGDLERHPRVYIALASVSPQEIDEINILQATHLAMRRALKGLSPAPDAALIDGRPVPDLPVPTEAIVGGDGISLSIAAASVIAKVARDRTMQELGARHPEYGFEKHMGYGTAQHLAALEKHGVLPEHRRSFAPVTALCDDPVSNA